MCCQGEKGPRKKGRREGEGGKNKKKQGLERERFGERERLIRRRRGGDRGGD